jgi:hypothetical protein
MYREPSEVAVEDVPESGLEHPGDVLMQITSSCICGSDLHMYEGCTAAEPGIVFGHENLGTVEEVGPWVSAPCRRPGGHAVRRDLRLLQELPGRVHGLLPPRVIRPRRVGPARSATPWSYSPRVDFFRLGADRSATLHANWGVAVADGWSTS